MRLSTVGFFFVFHFGSLIWVDFEDASVGKTKIFRVLTNPGIKHPVKQNL